jgi:pyrroloquinoline quinone biosynthesis protein D
VLANAVRFRQAERVLVQDSTDTLLLLALDEGMYFSLDGVGRRVWDLCDGTRSVEQLVDAIFAEFDAPREVIDADVRELIGQLAEEHLLTPVAT